MNHLSIPSIRIPESDDFLGSVAAELSRLPKTHLNCTPWPEFPYKPSVYVAMAYDEGHIYLQYEVEEKFLRAAAVVPNGPVWEDSCVEFFVSFDEGRTYYNLEFNCVGTGLIGYGASKPNRQRLSAEVVGSVQARSVINSGAPAHWTLTLAIPLRLFSHVDLPPLKGRSCRANFYKCGDATPEPHYVAWSDIRSERPNFHLPAYFGKIVFD